MFILIIKHYIIFLYILITIYISDCYTSKLYKYKEYVIEDFLLCSQIANRDIDLKNDEAVLVKQTTTKDHTTDWTKNLLCKFSIKSKTGLFAVVQHLNLRVDPSTGECIDYIQFTTKKHSFNPKLCGNYNVALNTEINPNFTTEDPYGYIETKIFIDKTRLVKETTDLKIVYTKYKRCDTTYKQCDGYSYCIHEQLFNDTLVNCPVNDCFDESGCQDLRKRLNLPSTCVDCVESNPITTKIILSAVTSLVVSFVVFVICIWICKKTGKVCWAAGCTSTARNCPSSRVIEMQNRSETAQSTVATDVPSAPDPEKDLPPSYDSLFPSR